MGNALTATEIHLAPLQGFTDFRFRNAFSRFFEGVDTYYTPWIKVSKDMELKKAYLKEVDPENNSGKLVIPQIMTNSPEELMFLAKYLYGLGYEKINWNLGCPYPMVAKRNLGSGLLKEPFKIISILERTIDKIPNTLSIKARIGYENNNDLVSILPELNNFKLAEIIIHPRIGKQMYKGKVDLGTFDKCLDLCKHSIVYNGDVSGFPAFIELKARYPQINKWMIGRGIIANPFLAAMIKNEMQTFPEDAPNIFLRFHDSLMLKYSEQLSGEKHLLQKMTAFWEYFSTLFHEPSKSLKAIKKSKSIQALKQNASRIIGSGF